MTNRLGVIEGFYGPQWTWRERSETMRFLAPHGYGFYLYAPKGDAFLRRRWQEPHPEATAQAMAGFAAECRGSNVRFGVGLSPYDAFREFDGGVRAALAAKLAFCDEVGCDDVAILFDDMRGDLPDLAERQAEIVEWAAGRTRAGRVVVCPSYYSDDTVLDRLFGARPAGYLRRLGELLDASVEIFWTGEEICSREYSAGHLERVAEQLGRRPFLWDNYPVNDSPRMSQHLHVRGFTGRPAALGAHASAHAINPALQPTLTRVPALTLAESYSRGAAYEYGAAQRRAAVAVLGETLGEMLHEDTALLHDVGLDQLGDRAATLRERYGAADHDGAREVIAWLDGRYRVTSEMVHAQ